MTKLFTIHVVFYCQFPLKKKSINKAGGIEIIQLKYVPTLLTNTVQ